MATEIINVNPSNYYTKTTEFKSDSYHPGTAASNYLLNIFPATSSEKLYKIVNLTVSNKEEGSSVLGKSTIYSLFYGSTRIATATVEPQSEVVIAKEDQPIYVSNAQSLSHSFSSTSSSNYCVYISWQEYSDA